MIDIARLAEKNQPTIDKYSAKALALYQEMEMDSNRFSGQCVLTPDLLYLIYGEKIEGESGLCLRNPLSFYIDVGEEGKSVKIHVSLYSSNDETYFQMTMPTGGHCTIGEYYYMARDRHFKHFIKDLYNIVGSSELIKDPAGCIPLTMDRKSNQLNSKVDCLPGFIERHVSNDFREVCYAQYKDFRIPIRYLKDYRLRRPFKFHDVDGILALSFIQDPDLMLQYRFIPNPIETDKLSKENADYVESLLKTANWVSQANDKTLLTGEILTNDTTYTTRQLIKNYLKDQFLNVSVTGVFVDFHDRKEFVISIELYNP